MVSILLIFLALLIMQAILYLYIRNVVVASAAQGARAGANADADPQQGAAVANRLIARALSKTVADEVRCVESQEPGEGGATLVMIRCTGELPLFFLPLGDVLPIDVRAEANKEFTAPDAE